MTIKMPHKSGILWRKRLWTAITIPTRKQMFYCVQMHLKPFEICS